jgi:ATP-dependent DNA helicase RecG
MICLIATKTIIVIRALTREELATTLNISVDGVKYHLQNMRKKGLIKHIGKSRGGKWIICF